MPRKGNKVIVVLGEFNRTLQRVRVFGPHHGHVWWARSDGAPAAMLTPEDEGIKWARGWSSRDARALEAALILDGRRR